MPAKTAYFVDTPDPLVTHPDDEHPLLWYYIGRPMGYLTRKAVALRTERYAANQRSLRGCKASEQSTFVDHGRK